MLWDVVAKEINEEMKAVAAGRYVRENVLDEVLCL